AHFHERRSERFMRHHRYEEAIKALETSLLYVQDAYKNIELPKSKEILDTLTLDFQRKLRQIEMRKTQHGLTKMKDFVPLKEASPMLPLRPENTGGSAQSVAKAIDKTVKEFDAKFTSTIERRATPTLTELQSDNKVRNDSQTESQEFEECPSSEHDMPSLTPLELPSFDYSMFTTSSAPTMTSYVGMAESFQK
ncbi:CG42554, partial [Drosophila busckii]